MARISAFREVRKDGKDNLIYIFFKIFLALRA